MKQQLMVYWRIEFRDCTNSNASGWSCFSTSLAMLRYVRSLLGRRIGQAVHIYTASWVTHIQLWLWVSRDWDNTHYQITWSDYKISHIDRCRIHAEVKEAQLQASIYTRSYCRTFHLSYTPVQHMLGVNAQTKATWFPDDWNVQNMDNSRYVLDGLSL